MEERSKKGIENVVDGLNKQGQIQSQTEVNISSYPGRRLPGLFFFVVQKY